MGFGNLRVINEDRIAPGSGFGTHGHRDMEIVSYVLDGRARAHATASAPARRAARRGVIRPGDVQRMSAGRGVQHSEFNHAHGRRRRTSCRSGSCRTSAASPPSYEQKRFDDADKRGVLRLVASPDGRDGSVTLHADASISAALSTAPKRPSATLDPQRKAYVHVVRGSVDVNGERLDAGDAAALTARVGSRSADGRQAEVLVFDLAA